MKISKETKEQIKKEPGKFLSCVSKVVNEKILYPENLFKYMDMMCPRSKSEDIYNLYGAMKLYEEYGNDYWYTVCRFAIFFKDDFMSFYSAKMMRDKQNDSLYRRLHMLDSDLQQLLTEEV